MLTQASWQRQAARVPHNILVYVAARRDHVSFKHTPVANKALPKVKTRITILADDDVTWPSTMLPWLLAPFEEKSIGGVGIRQKVKRLVSGTKAELIFNWLGAAYIER